MTHHSYWHPKYPQRFETYRTTPMNWKIHWKLAGRCWCGKRLWKQQEYCSCGRYLFNDSLSLAEKWIPLKSAPLKADLKILGDTINKTVDGTVSKY